MACFHRAPFPPRRFTAGSRHPSHEHFPGAQKAEGKRIGARWHLFLLCKTVHPFLQHPGGRPKRSLNSDLAGRALASLSPAPPKGFLALTTTKGNGLLVRKRCLICDGKAVPCPSLGPGRRSPSGRHESPATLTLPGDSQGAPKPGIRRGNPGGGALAAGWLLYVHLREREKNGGKENLPDRNVCGTGQE